VITLENVGITNTSKSAAIVRHAAGRVAEFLRGVGIEQATLRATDGAKAVLSYDGNSVEFDSRWLLSQWFGEWSRSFETLHHLDFHVEHGR
jgi:hypothetical protein